VQGGDNRAASRAKLQRPIWQRSLHGTVHDLPAIEARRRLQAYTLSAAGKLRRSVSGRYKLWHQDGTAL